jgi:hypothetical protein
MVRSMRLGSYELARRVFSEAGAGIDKPPKRRQRECSTPSLSTLSVILFRSQPPTSRLFSLISGTPISMSPHPGPREFP